MPTVDFMLEDLKSLFATKDDLQSFATKDDLRKFATKEDLRNFATKDDLQAFATKDDLQIFATKHEVRGIVREELEKFEPKVPRIVKLEVMDAEARIKREIKHYVDAEHKDLKETLGQFGQAAASWLASD